MLDAKLQWGPHIGGIKTKVDRHLNWYRRISGPIYGPSFENVRRVFTASIRSIIFYACGAWFARLDGGDTNLH